MSYNGLPFDDSLLKNLDEINKRIRLNKAGMIIIDGGVGEGKTTLAVHLAKYYQSNFMERIEDLLAMGGDEFLKSLRKAVDNDDKVVIYDEAGDFNSRGSLTYFNQNINRVFETYRQTKILVILCLPFFRSIDKSLFEKSIPRMLIHTYGRNKRQGNYKVYSLWRTWYLRKECSKLTVPQMCYLRVDANQRGHFKDLSFEERNVLADISIKGKKETIQKAYLNNKGLVDINEIASKTGYGKQTLYQSIRSSGFAKESIGRKSYYPKEIINYLLDKRTNNNIPKL